MTLSVKAGENVGKCFKCLLCRIPSVFTEEILLINFFDL